MRLIQTTSARSESVLASRMGRWAVAGVAMALLWSAPAQGGIVDDPQVANALNAARQLVAAAATSGRSVRGASDSIASLLAESDVWICGGWLVANRKALQQLAVEMGDNPPADLLQAYQALSELRNQILRVCDPIISGHDGPDGGGVLIGGGTGGDDEPSDDPCDDECAEEETAWDAAIYDLEDARRRLEEASDRRREAEALPDLIEEEKRKLERLELEIANAQGGYRQFLQKEAELQVEFVRALRERARRLDLDAARQAEQDAMDAVLDASRAKSRARAAWEDCFDDCVQRQGQGASTTGNAQPGSLGFLIGWIGFALTVIAGAAVVQVVGRRRAP